MRQQISDVEQSRFISQFSPIQLLPWTQEPEQHSYEPFPVLQSCALEHLLAPELERHAAVDIVRRKVKATKLVLESVSNIMEFE